MSEKPNQTNYLETPDGKKYGVYVFFTRKELEQIEYHCHKRKMSIPKWIVELVKDELNLLEDE